MAKIKPTPVPKTPALLRRGVAAFAVGLGLTGTACGDEITTQNSHPPQPLPGPEGGNDEDATLDAVPPVPPPLPISNDASMDARGMSDTSPFDARDALEEGFPILIPPPPHP
jgi:hypothetical protein